MNKNPGNKPRPWRDVLVLPILIALLTGCSKQNVPVSSVTLPPRLDSYFENYCDSTGSLGIGSVPSHTYDFRFRQCLKTSRDPEIKRLFVLQRLHQDVELRLDDLQKGIARIGKAQTRPITLEERRTTQQKLAAQIDDLATYASFTNFMKTPNFPLDVFDPGVEAGWIQELRTRLHSVTNAP